MPATPNARLSSLKLDTSLEFIDDSPLRKSLFSSGPLSTPAASKEKRKEVKIDHHKKREILDEISESTRGRIIRYVLLALGLRLLLVGVFMLLFATTSIHTRLLPEVNLRFSRKPSDNVSTFHDDKEMPSTFNWFDITDTAETFPTSAASVFYSEELGP